MPEFISPGNQMKKLEIPSIDNVDLFSKICQAKVEPRKSELSKLKQIVEQRYVEFNQTSDLSNLREYPFQKVEKEALIHAYTHQTFPIRELKIKIKKVQNSFYSTHCPYCGIFHSDTFDHYMNKDSYPEFSVYGLNLIPSCSRCNRKKNAVWLKNSIRQFIYFYSDNLPEIEFLKCTIISTKTNLVEVKFSLDTSKLPDSLEKKIIENHFKNLNLMELFEENCNEFLSEKKNTIENYFTGSHADLLSIMNSELSNFKEIYGLNNWKTALLAELIRENTLLSSWL